MSPLLQHLCPTSSVSAAPCTLTCSPDVPLNSWEEKTTLTEHRLGMQPWALSLPDKELCLREALAVCTPPAPEPSAKRPGS